MKSYVTGIVAAALVVLAIWLVSRERREQPSLSPPRAGETATAPPAEFEGTAAALGDSSALAPGSSLRVPIAATPKANSPRGRRKRRVTDATLLVHVVSEGTSRPIAAAEVSALETSPSVSIAFVRETSADGTLEYPVPSSKALTVSVRCKNPLFGSGEVKIPPLGRAERREIEVRLPVGGLTYFGRVLDRESGTPLESAVIEVQDRRHPDEPTRLDADDSGSFEMEVADRERFFLCIEADGFAEARGEIGKGHESSERAQIFRLSRPAQLHGHVVDGRGDPRNSIALWVGCDTDQLFQPESRTPRALDPRSNKGQSTSTDAAGEFSLSGLQPRVALQIFALEREHLQDRSLTTVWSRTLALGPGEDRELEIVVQQRVALVGTVLDPLLQPLSALTLWMESADETTRASAADSSGAGERPTCATAADGTFRFEGVVPGAWLVRSAPGSLSAAPLAELVHVEPAPAEQRVELRARRGLCIRGRVEGARGKPAGRVSVSASGSLFEGDESFAVGDDGSFVVGPLMEGRYSLAASFKGITSDPVEAKAGDENVVLRLKPPPAGWIRARPAGALPSEARVSLVPRAHPFRPRLADPDRVGEYCFGGLDPGLYDVFVTTDDGRWGGLAAVSPARERGPLLEIPLADAASLRVTYLGGPGGVCALRDGAVVAEGTIWVPGLSTVLYMPPGTIVLELTTMDSGWNPVGEVLSREVEAVLGEESEVVFP